jgi:hypothetical protein
LLGVNKLATERVRLRTLLECRRLRDQCPLRFCQPFGPAEVGRVRRPEVTPPTSLGASAVQTGSSFERVFGRRPTVTTEVSINSGGAARNAIGVVTLLSPHLPWPIATQYPQALPFDTTNYAKESLGFWHAKPLMCSAVRSTETETGRSGCLWAKYRG